MCHVGKKARQAFTVISIGVIFTAIMVWFYLSQSYNLEYNLGKDFISIKPKFNSLTIRNLEEKLFQMRFGSQIKSPVYAADCNIHTGIMSACIDWINATNSVTYARAIMKYEDLDGDVNCLNVHWEVYSADFQLEDCISMDIGHWYGGAEIYHLKWPLEKSSIPMQPYVSMDLIEHHQAYGSVLERYWLSSNGIAIIVDKTTPLHASINEGDSEELCLRSSYRNSPYKNPLGILPHLKYSICLSKDMRKVHDFIAKKNFKKPLDMPDKRMFESPIWSTSVRYKKNITQELVLSYANEIKENQFPCSHIEIDDFYNTQYGEIDFDSQKFPKPPEMIQQLHGLGFRVGSWFHPFANFYSNSFKEGLSNGYWICDSKNTVPGLVKWWNGVAATIDPTNPEAAEWFLGRLRNLQEVTGIDSFKFDAGEAQFLPLYFSSNETLNDPNLYCSRYVSMVAEMGSMVEVRCGHQSQQYPVFVQIMNKDSTWGYENGLKTLIPSVILFGILGYPFVLPNMIGGSGYINGNISADDKPERELFIRWLEVTAYLPSMQFSITPWQYDDEVVSIAKKMVSIHNDKVAPLVLELAKETLTTGHPIIRPLWWIAPKDPNCHQLDSEFLIGDSFLVAPILEFKARDRDIYLPAGLWKDTSTTNKYPGGKWIEHFSVPLDHVATFEKISEE
ncbi:myogenesis-regulating glycosidase-like [Anneissia japonica]|uniref:myogenesis-regulating glycosidase-like n=1 Tax=Anneissia japonica TaxID=1529436 RepID=UPI001425AFBD|nr:myogenesis-regulating glycosidase-like [Anneissia japonica]XP_033107540.1 myogenesis-regulating glycosidase-like [Anneissia japonica]